MPDIPTGTKIVDLSEAGKRLSNAWNALRGKNIDRSGDNAISSRDFGPGQPLAPRTDPDSPEQTEGPRQYQYPVSVNTFPAPRREQPGLTPFEQLRNLATVYDVAAIAIAAKIEEIQGLGKSFVAKDKKKQKDYQEACDEANRFFAMPDGLNDWSSWLGMAMYDVHSIDALTIYKRPNQGGGLYGLEIVDGSTIKPLMDTRGRVLAYQQVLYGYPFSEYKRPSTEEPDEQFPTFGKHELIYKPRWTRAFTPYGFPPTEWIILRINTAIRKQMFDMSWFTDGNSPEGFANPPGDSQLNPEKVQQFEVWYNAVLAGDDSARNRIRFLPWNMQFTPWKQFSYETALDEWMLKVTCAAFGIPPQEIGFTNDINKGTADMQENINERRGTRPTAKWFKDAIIDPLIPELGDPIEDGETVSLPGQPTRPVTNPFTQIEMQWKFSETEDTLLKAQTDQAYWTMGVVSSDELRSMRYGTELDGAAPGAPQLQQNNPFGGANNGAPEEAANPGFFRRQGDEDYE